MTQKTGNSPVLGPTGQILSLQISEVKRWVAIAVLLTVVILGIYGIQSYRGWSSYEKTISLSARTATLSTILSRSEPPLADMASQLENDQQELEKLRQNFEYVTVDSLIAMLTGIASSSDVDLASITVADPKSDEINGLEYEIQQISVTAIGTTPEIFTFLEALDEPAPSAMVSSVQLAGVGSDSLAKINFHFYLSPTTVVDPEAEDGAN